MKRPYTPDMAALLREADPARRKEYQRKAREDMARPTPAGFFQATEDTDAPAGDARRVSAASPGAKDGESRAVDASAPPSAMMPAADLAPAEERPVTKAAARAAGPVARKWPATWIIVLGCIAFMMAVGLIGVLVMLGRMTEQAGVVAAVPSARAVVEPSPLVDATALPNGMAIPSATATADAPARGTAAPPAAPAPILPRKQTGRLPEPKQEHTDPAPPPSVTVAPAPAVPTASAIAPLSPPVKNPIEGDRVFGN